MLSDMLTPTSILSIMVLLFVCILFTYKYITLITMYAHCMTIIINNLHQYLLNRQRGRYKRNMTSPYTKIDVYFSNICDTNYTVRPLCISGRLFIFLPVIFKQMYPTTCVHIIDSSNYFNSPFTCQPS